MVRSIEPLELQRLLQAGQPVLLLDVRYPEENALCELPNSQLIPLPELPARVGEVNASPETLVVVYCHHGVRSLSGAAVLSRAGLVNLASLTGGIDAWSRFVDPSVPRY